MSTNTLTTSMEGEAADTKPHKKRCCRCCISRRTGALLVGGMSVLVLLASMSATVLGIATAPDTPPDARRGVTSLSDADQYAVHRQLLDGKKKKGPPGKSVGGILVEGGLRDPASGGGSGAVADPEPKEGEGEKGEQGAALIVVGSRGRGGGGGRLVGGAGGGQLFFAPAADKRPVYIIRQPSGRVAEIIVGTTGDLKPGDSSAANDSQEDSGAVITESDATENSNSSASSLDTAGITGALLLTVDDGPLPDGSDNPTNSTNSTTSTTERPILEPPPLSEHLWLRAERGPLAVALALQIVFLGLTLLMLYGIRRRREDLVLLWLVSAAFGLAVGSAGAVLSALSAFDAGTPGGYLVGFGYLGGLTVLWCGWAVVVAYHRQATPPEFDNSHPHFG